MIYVRGHARVRVSMCVCVSMYVSIGALPCVVGMTLHTPSPTHVRTSSRPTSLVTEGAILLMFRSALSSVRMSV